MKNQNKKRRGEEAFAHYRRNIIQAKSEKAMRIIIKLQWDEKKWPKHSTRYGEWKALFWHRDTVCECFAMRQSMIFNSFTLRRSEYVRTA